MYSTNSTNLNNVTGLSNTDKHQLITTNYLKDFIHSESLNNTGKTNNFNKTNTNKIVEKTTPLIKMPISNGKSSGITAPLSTKSSTAKKYNFNENIDKVDSNAFSTNVKITSVVPNNGQLEKSSTLNKISKFKESSAITQRSNDKFKNLFGNK